MVQPPVDPVCGKQKLTCVAPQGVAQPEAASAPSIPACRVSTRELAPARAMVVNTQRSNKKVGCVFFHSHAPGYCAPQVPTIDNIVSDTTTSPTLQYRALHTLPTCNKKLSSDAIRTPTLGCCAPHSLVLGDNEVNHVPQVPLTSEDKVDCDATRSPTVGCRTPHVPPSCAALTKGDGEWKLVSKRNPKLKYRYLGQMGKAQMSESTFKAAVIKTPVFISNVHKNTLESDVIDYIFVKTQERVSLEKIYIKKQVEYKAYKFFRDGD